MRPVDLDESLQPGEAPHEYVLRLAAEKASADCRDGELVLAADTCVVIDGEILGKPSDPEEARSMLQRLTGCWHQVFTGVALARRRGGEVELVRDVERSDVRIAALETSELEWYVATGEGADKAGAYAIQGLGALFVEANRGNYHNIVGLPLPLLYRLFRALDEDLLGRIGRSA